MPQDRRIIKSRDSPKMSLGGCSSVPQTSELIYLENTERKRAALFFTQSAAYPLYIFSQLVG